MRECQKEDGNMQKASVAQGKRSITIITYLTLIFEIITITLTAYSRLFESDFFWLITIARIVVELSAIALMYSGKSYARFLAGTVLGIMTIINIILFINFRSTLVSSQIVLVILLLLIQASISIYPFLAKDISGYAIYTTQLDELDWIWNWSGKCFGYIDRDELWKYTGQFAGLIVSDDNVSEIYNENGEYIGEVYSNGRLVSDLTKADKTIDPYNKPSQRPSFDPLEDKIKMPLYNNYKDFWL